MSDLSVPQGPEGRAPNVSPARTFLPRDAGWRIALYAVFVKKTALATLSSAAKGEARGRAGESIREDEMSAGGAAPNLYLTVRPRLARNDSNVRPIRCPLRDGTIDSAVPPAGLYRLLKTYPAFRTG